ncbi:MAG: SPOR domain-containing protein [Deltaproteobacteria bacterium]|nr:SPOR domain-containing protein [Deltaproteobacteria bacterium]
MKERGHRERPLWVPAVLLLLTLSCAGSPSEDPDRQPALQDLLAEPGAKIAVILPFDTPPDEPEIGPLVRTAFYSHFSPRNYLDIEPSRVDRLLDRRDDETEEGWRHLSPVELGALFRSDFVIYGRVLNFDRTFLGIYSQIVLTVGLEMVSCRTGEGVWRKTLTKRSHDGGLPFSLFEVIPAALRSSLHMTHERTVGLVDRVSRELAAEIPEPADPRAFPSCFDLQVASFLDPVKAELTVRRFERDSRNGRIEPISLNGRVYHRVLLGPYPTAAEAEEARRRITAETAFQPIVIHRDE